MLSTENRELLKTVPLYHRIGFEFDDGWTDLIYTLGMNISNYCELHKQELPQMRQIKEKFASLRFYYSGNNDDYIRNLVREAEEKSGAICEKCGKPGKTFADGGRWYTACPEHFIEGSLTAEEYKVIQEERSRAMRKCDVCSTKGSDGFYDSYTSKFTNRCPRHVEDYFITNEEYWDNKSKEKDD